MAIIEDTYLPGVVPEVHEKIVLGQNLSGQNLSGQNLSGQNLSAQNVSAKNILATKHIGWSKKKSNK
jgi:uncharacterized protein YjbI with pentapeptide repeats